MDPQYKGHLTPESIMQMQTSIATQCNMPLPSQNEKSLLVSRFLAQAHDSKVTWPCFRDVMLGFLASAPCQEIAQLIVDQEGFLLKSDLQSLYLHIQAFFLQSQYSTGMLTRAHLVVENLEGDILSMWTVTQLQASNSFEQYLIASKMQADSFGDIQQLLASQITHQVLDGFQRLQQMLEVTYCLQGPQIHELDHYGEHIRRIFDLTLASPAMPLFASLLQMADESVDILSVKLSVLKCLCLLSIGNTLFGGQEIQLRLQQALGNPAIVMTAFAQTKSTCDQVINESFRLIGYFLKNEIQGVQQILADPNNFHYIYSAISDQQRTECLQYISWSLYIFCLKQFQPGSESTLQLNNAHATVIKLAEILKREDCVGNLLTCTLLALSRVIHMHPPNQLTTDIFTHVVGIFQSNLHGPDEYVAALKCIYLTVKATKIHNSTLVQTKVVGVMQAILEWQSADDKIKLIALQSLRELASGGYHMALLDLTVVATLLKYLNGSENSKNALYQATLEVIQALATPTQFSLETLVNQGIVKTICRNLISFKVDTDQELSQFEDKRPAIPTQLIRGVKYLNFNFYFQSLHTLDIIANASTNIQKAFNTECLESFKPIIEIFAQLLANQKREFDDPTLKLTIERTQSFLSAIKRKAGFESQLYSYANMMILFLEQADSTSLLKDDSLLTASGVFQVICYSLKQDALESMPNRMLEVPCKATYRQVQDAIDAKYNHPVLLQYIDDDQQDVLVDSDLVLRKAIQKAIRDSYYDPVNTDATLRFLVSVQQSPLSLSKQSHLIQFQCYECGSQFYKDTRYSYGQGSANICTSCFQQQNSRNYQTPAQFQRSYFQI